MSGRYPCPTCDYRASDPLTLSAHRHRVHDERVEARHATLALADVPPPAPPAIRSTVDPAVRPRRFSQDRAERTEWQLDQIRLGVLVVAVWCAVTLIGLTVWAAALILGG